MADDLTPEDVACLAPTFLTQPTADVPDAMAEDELIQALRTARAQPGQPT